MHFQVRVSGLNNASNRLAATSGSIANFGIAAGGSTDDLAKNEVDLIGEKTQFKASALMLKTADRMLGNLLDVLDTDPRT